MKSKEMLMRSKYEILILFASLLILLVCHTVTAEQIATPNTSTSNLVLAKVDVESKLEDISLPIYSDLVNGRGDPYVLSIASMEQLQKSGLAYAVLDTAPAGTRYLLATSRSLQDRQAAKNVTDVLYDDGLRIVARYAPGLTAALSRLGLSPRPLSSTPISYKSIQPPQRTAKTITKSNAVQAMLDKVSSTNLSDSIAGLSGDRAVDIGGEQYEIITRNTSSGTPIQKATQYIYEQLNALGLNVSYQEWSSDEYSGRNVIGELRGVSKPSEIILMVAHLDSINETTEDPASPAPGADDDGSGCAALLAAAQIMKDYRFERTIRFVFTTGEEDGLLGSDAYAKKLSDEAQNVLDVLNLDMVAYSTQSSPVQNLHTRIQENPGYQADLAIATMFIDIVNLYGLSQSLVPVILKESNDEGDQYSF